MNLPAHGTTSPDPSVAALLKQHTKQTKDSSISAWLDPHAARQNCSRPPGSIHSPLGANVLPESLFPHHRLAEHTVPPSVTQCRALSCRGYHLAVISGPPGAIPEASCNWFGTLTDWFQTRTLPQASLFSFIMTLCKNYVTMPQSI